MVKRYPISGFILVGGKSSRMGEDKALLQIDGQTLLARSIALLRPLCESVCLIGSGARYSQLGLDVEILEDRVEPCGPLGGILTGLLNSTPEYALFLACDLPLMTEKFLHYLAGAALTEKPDVVVPVNRSGEYEPLCAVYSRKCIPWIESARARHQMKISDFYPLVERLRVIGTGEILHFSRDFKIFSNLNTPEEFAAAREFLEAKDSGTGSNQRS